MTPPRYALEITSPPAVEPIDLGEAKSHCKVEVDDENDLFEHWIRTARRLTESLLGVSLITQTVKVYFDEFPCWEMELPHSPVQSITGIAYVDSSGDAQTLAASDYQADTKSRPARVVPSYGNVWPVTRYGYLNAVTVTMVAGFGDSGEDVPDEILRAMYLAIATWNFYREATPTELPVGVQTLLLSCWDGRY
jgi:uncharacterized phiE125 gp8 family phage protein